MTRPVALDLFCGAGGATKGRRSLEVELLATLREIAERAAELSDQRRKARRLRNAIARRKRKPTPEERAANLARQRENQRRYKRRKRLAALLHG